MMSGAELDEKKVALAVANRERELDLFERDASQESLREYTRNMWEVLEPGRRLAWGYSLDAICEHLEAVTHGHIRKLLINVPPGMMKSLLTNVLWPSWEWGPRNLPHLRYVSASYSETLTVRDNLRGRQLIESDKYQRWWGANAGPYDPVTQTGCRFRFVEDQNSKTHYANDKTGFRLATSVGGTATGQRGDRVIIDDPHSVKQSESPAIREETLRWFTETMPSRSTDPRTAAFIVIMQRVHEQDVSGLILEQDLGYVHLCLPMEFEPERTCYTVVRPSWRATPEPVFRSLTLKYPAPAHILADIANGAGSEQLRSELGLPPRLEDGPRVTADEIAALDLRWEPMYCWDNRFEEGELVLPDRYPPEEVEDLKKQMRAWGGTYAEAGQLQQRPSPRGGGLFKRDDFKVVLEPPPVRLRRVRAWDLAGSKTNRSAWTAGARLCIWNNFVYIENVVRFRGSPSEVEARILATAKMDGRGCYIDIPQDPGQAGLHQKQALAGLLEGYEFHFSPDSGSKEDRARPLASQAEVGNLRLLDGPWVPTFLGEVESFPKGRYKDQVDAATRAYARLLQLKGREDEGGSGVGLEIIYPDKDEANDGFGHYGYSYGSHYESFYH